ncbi:hypothetical protein HDA40_004596 [Hamadaea flava]|uniref:DUF11 domain-containing protein n=1 Tax=Hamadaea flava TaxID=1742688 RepID=A0ABV8LGA7_9ACTN|nr:hypothetical protein [Hamadaea flava]MCP2326089.1 hypothetical protein [Hamadaea flava]
MNEFDQDALLTGAFSEFSATSAPAVRPLGAQAVRGEVAHRRKVRAVALGVVAALVIALPVAGYAAFGRESQAPPTPGTSIVPTPSASESPSPSPSVSASSVPDGRITIAQLTAGKVDVPKWGASGETPEGNCNDGRTAIRKVEKFWKTRITYIIEVAYANLDDDPALETAAILTCRTGEMGPSMIVAYDRDLAGQIVSLGTVVRASAKMQGIWHVKPADGDVGVSAEVSDIVACCDTSADNEFHQWRTYAWNGTAFVQTAGRTDFSNKPLYTDLKLTLGKVTSAKNANGDRDFSIEMTVSNIGKVTSAPMAVDVWSEPGDLIARDWVGRADECHLGTVKCHPALKPGESFTMTVHVIMGKTLVVGPDAIHIRVDGAGRTGGTLADPNPKNNYAEVLMTAELWNII